MSDLVIGIDPDLVKSGVGVVRNGTLEELYALNIVDLQAFIKEGVDLGAHFVVEDVESMKPTFPRYLNAKSRASRELQMQKISQNVGQVKAIARIVCQYLEAYGASFTKVKPLTGNRRYRDASGRERIFRVKGTKECAILFNEVTGWTGKSSEDKRDAAMLALYGLGRA